MSGESRQESTYSVDEGWLDANKFHLIQLSKVAESIPRSSFAIDQICEAGMMVAEQSSVENVRKYSKVFVCNRSDFRGRNGGSQQSTVENNA
eukprot:scaffold2539_cov74-Cylindrotheca_fusiformis.AAC.1